MALRVGPRDAQILGLFALVLLGGDQVGSGYTGRRAAKWKVLHVGPGELMVGQGVGLCLGLGLWSSRLGERWCGLWSELILVLVP